MLVTYFFQGEVGESLDFPNAFMMNNGNGKINFGQFLQQFPMGRDNQMHFRFRADDQECGYVWIDVSDPSTVLPTYSGQICAKILKLDSVNTNRRKLILKRKLISSENPLVQKVQAQFAQTSLGGGNRRSASDSNVPATTAGSAPQPPGKPAKPLPKVPVQERAQRGGSIRLPPPAAADPAAGKQSPFFETEANYVSPPPSVSSAPAPNIFGDDDDDVAYTRSPIQQQRASYPPPSSSAGAMDIDDGISDLKMPDGPSRATLAARKEEAIDEKVKGALDFKKEMDMKKEQESIEFDAAREKHENAILAWSTNNKEKRNIRNLLSTMHTVLPAETKWKAIGLGDVLESSQVKKQYRKAMLVVHPDHTINAKAESKFICKRIFEAINEAYDEFLKKEGV